MRGELAAIMVVIAVATGGPASVAVAQSATTVPAGEDGVIPSQWLDKEVSVAQAEAEHMVDGKPFGASNDAWKQLKASLRPGDAIWTYCSPAESFRAHAGRCGIALVRNGKTVTQFVTIMN